MAKPRQSCLAAEAPPQVQAWIWPCVVGISSLVPMGHGPELALPGEEDAQGLAERRNEEQGHVIHISGKKKQTWFSSDQERNIYGAPLSPFGELLQQVEIVGWNLFVSVQLLCLSSSARAHRRARGGWQTSPVTARQLGTLSGTYLSIKLRDLETVCSCLSLLSSPWTSSCAASHVPGSSIPLLLRGWSLNTCCRKTSGSWWNFMLKCKAQEPILFQGFGLLLLHRPIWWITFFFFKGKMQFLQIIFSKILFSYKENQNLNVLAQVDRNEKRLFSWWFFGFLFGLVWFGFVNSEIFHFVVYINFCLCFSSAGPHRGYNSSTSHLTLSNRNSSVNRLHPPWHITAFLCLKLWYIMKIKLLYPQNT